MTDIARLGFSADTSPLKTAKTDLEALAPAATKAEAAVENFNAEAQTIGAATRAAAGGLAGLGGNLATAASGAQLLQTEMARIATGADLSGRALLNVGTAMQTVQTAAAGTATGIANVGARLTAGKIQLDSHVKMWQMYKRELESVPAASNKAESAIKRLGAAANDNINAMQATPGNIAAQFQDIGVTAAGGMEPYLIALQQGTQLAAGMQGGLGVLGAAFAQLLNPITLVTIAMVGLVAAGLQMVDWPKLASDSLRYLASIIVEISPYLAGMAAAIAVIYAPAIIAGIGTLITAFHAARVAVVSFLLASPAGWVLALGIAVAAAVKFRDELTKIFGVDIVKAAADGFNYIVGTAIGVYKGLVAAWDFLPGAFADIGIRAANALIRGLREAAVQAINLLNPLRGLLDTVGIDLGQMVIPNIQINNPYAGMEKSVNSIVTSTITINQNTQWLGKMITGVKSVAADVAKQFEAWAKSVGMTDEKAKKLKDTVAKKGVDEALKEYEQQVKAAEDFAEALELEAKKIGLTTVELKRMEVAMKALEAPTEALRQRIVEAGKAWEVAFLKNEIKTQDTALSDLEKQIELTEELNKLRLEAHKMLTGDELRDRLADITREGEKQKNMYEAATKAQEWTRLAMEATSDEARDLYESLADGAMQAGELKNEALDMEHSFKRSVDEIERMNGALGGCFDWIDKIAGTDLSGIWDGLLKGFPSVANKLGKVFDDMLSKLGTTWEKIQGGMQIGGAAAKMTGGSNTGGQIGGALGQLGGEAIAGALGKLGAFAGPLGAIAGGILGGIIGGLFKSTPKASATVSIIAGEVMDTAIKGNSGKLKKIAGEMANGLISGLSDLADALGAQLTGDALVSVGVRKGKYRVDTTGQGITKKSKGAIDFGEDKAAAIAFAIQDAIKDGVLGGLSQSMQNLIMADGDLQTQIEKALSFKSVFDELAKNDDPAKFAQDEITRWHDSMVKLFQEANATAEELAELERLTGIKRVAAAKEFEQEINDVTELERDRKNLLIRIAEMEGRSTEALAMAREMEKASVDASLRPLYDRIYALEDEATAAAEAQRIADERIDLETRLLQAQGDTVALRQRELDALDPTNRALLQMIFALEDATAAAAAAKAVTDERTNLETRLLQAQGDTATLRQRELDALDPTNRALLQLIFNLEDTAAAAVAAKAVADERYNLETRLLQAQGDTVALRQRELEALDPANRALLQLIFTTEDAAAAFAAAAAKQQAAMDEIAGLNRQWLELTGQTEKLRDLDLAELQSDEARAIQEKIWAYQDMMAAQEAAAQAAEAAAKAQQEWAKAVEDARKQVEEAYKRERGELEKNAQSARDFAESMRDFRMTLIASLTTIDQTSASARGRYNTTLNAALGGDQKAMSGFTGAAKEYLDAARRSARTENEFRNAVAEVARGSMQLETMGANDAAQVERQIALMDQQVSGIIAVSDNVVTLTEAIENFRNLSTQENTAMVNVTATGLASVSSELATLTSTTASNNEDRKTEAVTISGRLLNVELLLERVITGNTVNVTVANENIATTATITNVPLLVTGAP